MDDLAPKDVIFIAGTHRSGTSALARVVNLLGVPLPADLLHANSANETGYWESRELVELNETLLGVAGHLWHVPRQVSTKALEQAAFAEPGTRALSFLKRLLSENRQVLLKDPRLAQLLPFWLTVAHRLALRPLVMLPCRHPFEVAASLYRRDGIPFAKGLLLWLVSALEAERHSRPVARAVLSYEALLADWRGCLRQAGSQLGVDWSRRFEDAGSTIDRFLDPALRHQRTDAVNADGPAALAIECYEALMQAEGPAREKALGRIRAELEPWQSAIDVLLADSATREVALTGRLSAQESENRRLQAARFESERRKDLLGLLRALLKHGRGRRLLIWGAGSGGERTWTLLEELGVPADGFIDSSPSKRGLSLAGRPVLDPAEAGLSPGEGAYLVIGSSYSDEIARGLTALGYERERDFLANPFLEYERDHVIATLVDGSSGARMEHFLKLHYGEEALLQVEALLRGFGLSFADDRSLPEPSSDEVRAWLARLAEKAGSADVPEVTIVLPVHNQVRYTLACLQSLLAHRTQRRLEVLVADDSSTDGTTLLADTGLSRVRYLRNRHNLGFLRNCNAAAKQARGRYLVFLNNDTIVLPGWLDELLDTLQRHPQAGLVGSRLIYPDGRLQEAGGVLWRDGSAANIGRNQDPLQPEFAYLREVDYCSGASIALPRDLWHRLDGFDEEYAPAYGEDSDLALRVVQAGYKVLVQPLSGVIHFEGISHGTATETGIKSHQVENRRRLFERWREVLAAHGPNGQVDDVDRRIRRRALVIDHLTPACDRDAGSITCFELMRALSAIGFQVTFIPETNLRYTGKDTRELQRLGIQAVYAPYYRSVEEYLSRYGPLFDLVLVFRVQVAQRTLPAVQAHCPRAAVIFHTSDLHFLRERRQAALEGSAEREGRAAALRETELGVIAQAAATVVHSSYEAELLLRELPQAKVYVFPWIYDAVGSANGFHRRSGFIFIGGYRHSPNVDAVLHFVGNIWPLVRAQLPGVEFHVVGSDPPAEILDLDGKDGVHVLGYVPDIAASLSHVRVAVAPLRYGAGLKGKVVTGLAHGVPCIATPVAAEGMHLQDGVNVVLADGPAAFARAAVALHRDEARWQRLSSAGVDHVQGHYGRALGIRRTRELLALAGVSLPAETGVRGVGA